MDRIILQKGAHASPVIAEFCRSWNDALNDTDRQKLVPVALDAVGTNTGPDDDLTRSWMAVDWLARVQAPAWLRLAKLTAHAEALEGLARIVDAATAGQAQPTLNAAREASDAAWDDAWAAAGAAAWDAAWDAAWAAAWAALRPTVEALQVSALDLLRRMCEVGRNPVAIHEDRAAVVRVCHEIAFGGPHVR